MNILIHSNACWAPTGYGQQCALLATRLRDHGHNVGVSAFYGLHGAPLDWQGIRHYPAGMDAYGNDVLQAHAQQHFGGNARDGLVITLVDAWVLNPDVMRNLNVACWTPVDHDPCPPAVRQFFDRCDAIPIAMSQFGQDRLDGFDPLYAPHGIDTQALCPGDQSAARRSLGLPEDAFVVGMVAANKGNPSRKSFDEAFQAFALLLRDHPDAILYLHTEAEGRVDGVHLPALLHALKIPPPNVMFCDQYAYQCLPITTERLADTYRAMDVLLNPSQGEGFGITVLEAQACGTPVIVSDFTAMPEVGKVGWHVPGQRHWSQQGSWQIRPNVEAIHGALVSAIDIAPRLAADAREHALTYDADRVVTEHWLPVLDQIEQRIQARTTAEAQAPRPVGRKRPSVTVVTPWVDHPEFVGPYWEAMAAGKPDRTLVIDNASETPVERASLRLEENVGFSAASNLGLREADTDAVVFLNNDIRMTSPDWLDTLLAHLEPGVLVGARLRSEPHTHVDGHPVPYLDGWCLAGMTADLKRIGGWDEGFEEPSYYGDNDLAVRARAAGLELREAPIGLQHLENGTTRTMPNIPEITARNRERYERRVREMAA